jgi:transcriptional regulator with XRE-family HTH domain
MLLRHAIGAALRRIRLDDGRTLREVSQAANISMPYLSEIERGRKEPSSEILAGLCAALGLTLLDLLNEVSFEAQLADAVVVDLTAPARSVTTIAPARASEIALAVAA